MKFEHHKQKLLPIKHFVKRVFLYFLLALGLIFISMLIGVLGYHYLGKLNLIDSIHMSSMILTGMGPVAEMKTDSAKLFSSFYALYSGVVFLSIAAVLFAPIIHRILHILNLDNEEE